ncbi:VOC family protein [Streptomyces sp. NPDC051561]|uniref:VOC family protein n=1 Tax=Streptomyces sp. NPDC051561 TaxID=3365658 RepID=UPI0037BC8417
MTSVVQHITFGCPEPYEPYEIAEFWSEALGRSVDMLDAPGDDTVALVEDAGQPVLMFVRSEEKKSERNGVLLSLRPEGTRDAEVRRLTGLGATLVDETRTNGWALLADPAGNEFRVGAGVRDREQALSAADAPPAGAVVPNAVVLRRTDEGYQGVQGGIFTQGVSAETVDTKALCLHEVRIPPHTRGEPHVHAGHESAIYIISGRHRIHHGEGLAASDELGPGDMVFIPADTPHMPVTGDEAVHCVVARTDPREQESVHLLSDALLG